MGLKTKPERHNSGMQMRATIAERSVWGAVVKELETAEENVRRLAEKTGDPLMLEAADSLAQMVSAMMPMV